MKNLFTLLSLVILLSAQAQQRPHYSQYINNQYLINPAEAGSQNYHHIMASNRMQWMGVPGAPNTFYITGEMFMGQHVGLERGKIKNEHNYHHGLGFQAVGDKTGPTSLTGLSGTYAYHFRPAQEIVISFGASFGFLNYGINSAELDAFRETATTEGQSFFRPDGALGIFSYSKNWFAGISSTQIIRQKIDLNTVSGSNNSYLEPHVFITGGYKIRLDDEIYLLPNGLIKYVNGVPLSWDINMKYSYNDIFWTGISYRSLDAVTLMAGIHFFNNYEFSYSYDYTTSDLSEFNNGGHEITIGYRINPHTDTWSPQDFW